jgi:alpha-tubulin suppressor-like RCC1 family protein
LEQISAKASLYSRSEGVNFSYIISAPGSMLLFAALRLINLKKNRRWVMSPRRRNTVTFILIMSLSLSSCGPGQLFGAKRFISVAAGQFHTCGLTSDGRVKCWGGNSYGELGDGKILPYGENTPVDVLGLGSRIKAITAGSAHTCALNVGGGVKCWGNNGGGQLGNGTITEMPYAQPEPVDVLGLTSGVSAIAAGYSHTCALTIDGGVKCWGKTRKVNWAMAQSQIQLLMASLHRWM